MRRDRVAVRHTPFGRPYRLSTLDVEHVVLDTPVLETLLMPAELPVLLDRPTAARLLAVKESTLRKWWTAGRGPRGVKLSTAKSGRVMYARSEVEAFARDPLAYERSARPDTVPAYDPPQRREGRQYGR